MFSHKRLHVLKMDILCGNQCKKKPSEEKKNHVQTASLAHYICHEVDLCIGDCPRFLQLRRERPTFGQRKNPHWEKKEKVGAFWPENRFGRLTFLHNMGERILEVAMWVVSLKSLHCLTSRRNSQKNVVNFQLCSDIFFMKPYFVSLLIRKGWWKKRFSSHGSVIEISHFALGMNHCVWDVHNSSHACTWCNKAQKWKRQDGVMYLPVHSVTPFNSQV